MSVREESDDLVLVQKKVEALEWWVHDIMVDPDSSLTQMSLPSCRTRSQVVEKLMQYLRYT